MASKKELQEAEQAIASIGELLIEAVQATIEHRSHEPARPAVGVFRDIDARAAPDSDSGPAQLMAMLTLVRWTTVLRGELAEHPQPVDDALAWIEENLGKRYRARAGYASPLMRDQDAAADVATYQRALREEFLPALIWLVAGVVAVFGEGSTDWLRGLDAGTPSAGLLPGA